MFSQKHKTSLCINSKGFQRSLEKDLHSKQKLSVSISQSSELYMTEIQDYSVAPGQMVTTDSLLTKQSTEH